MEAIRQSAFHDTLTSIPLPLFQLLSLSPTFIYTPPRSSIAPLLKFFMVSRTSVYWIAFLEAGRAAPKGNMHILRPQWVPKEKTKKWRLCDFYIVVSIGTKCRQGGEGVQNPDNFADVVRVCFLSSERTTPPLLPPALKMGNFLLPARGRGTH